MYNVIPQREQNGYTVAELFAGGGLMTAGLKAAGYALLWANDFDKSACIAYRHNHGDYTVHGDITQIDPDDIPDSDIIAGGPPCQDYSVAGQGAGEDGERGKLVWTYLSIIERKKPKAFVFENVKGLVGKAHQHTFAMLIDQFNAIGYRVSYKIVNAWEYGVAQKRERVFIVGIRSDLGFNFVFPDPMPEDYRTQVLRDVIGDLPDPVEQENGRYSLKKPGGRREERTPNKWDEPLRTLCMGGGYGPRYGTPSAPLMPEEPLNHAPQELSERAIAYLHSKNGRSLKKHRPPTLDEPSQTIVSNNEKGVPYGLFYPDNHERKDISEKALDGYERRGGNGGFAYRVNDWNEPSPTIFGRIFNEGKAFVHPSAKDPPDNHEGALFDNVNLEWTYEKANRPAEWDKPGATVGGHARNEGIHPDFAVVENHDRWKKLATDAERLPKLPESISTVGAAGILGDVYMQNYAKAGNDEPALTVAAIGYPKPHPKKPRRFTVRECLRIQSVPDWYVFPDSISLSAQYRIVGNGVASRVAYLLGIALAVQLDSGTANDGQIDLFELIEEPNLNRRQPKERTRERRRERA